MTKETRETRETSETREIREITQGSAEKHTAKGDNPGTSEAGHRPHQTEAAEERLQAATRNNTRTERPWK